jgi:cell division protein ZapA (FtsZ GTPase activity inhibitor)
MAALTMADELSEMTLRLRRLEDEFASMQDARVNAADRSKTTQASVATALTAAAERIESVTRKLNQTVGSGVAIG